VSTLLNPLAASHAENPKVTATQLTTAMEPTQNALTSLAKPKPSPNVQQTTNIVDLIMSNLLPSSLTLESSSKTLTLERNSPLPAQEVVQSHLELATRSPSIKAFHTLPA
jgi:hypothetical protein